MIAHTTLPESLWKEVLKTTVYLLNKIPSKTVAKTSYGYGLGNLPTSGISIFGIVQQKLGYTCHMIRNWTPGRLVVSS